MAWSWDSIAVHGFVAWALAWLMAVLVYRARPLRASPDRIPLVAYPLGMGIVYRAVLERFVVDVQFERAAALRGGD